MYVTKETLADALRDILVETDKGLRAARDVSVMCRMPDAIEIEFDYLIEESAVDDVVTTSDTSPAMETTETRSVPETVEVSEEERPLTVTESETTETNPEVVSVRKVERGEAISKDTVTKPRFITDVANCSEGEAHKTEATITGPAAGQVDGYRNKFEHNHYK